MTVREVRAFKQHREVTAALSMRPTRSRLQAAGSKKPTAEHSTAQQQQCKTPVYPTDEPILNTCVLILLRSTDNNKQCIKASAWLKNNRT